MARLAAYRGIARLGALTIASEVGDWRRFPAARTFMGFTGLVHVRVLLRRVGPSWTDHQGGQRPPAPRDATVAVVAADRSIDALARLVDREGVTLLPASLVKVLEYDHVIVVEPTDIVAAEPRGVSRLYVVLTRAVASLVVLHHAPLPAPVRT